MSDEGENTAEKLMGALISKMENMDSDLRTLKQENLNLRKAIADPMNMLRKAGFVMSRTETPTGIPQDDFRPMGDDMLIKGTDIDMPSTNEEFHQMEWAEIHALAESAKSAGSTGNNMGIE
jgi:hypothetical protein